VLFPNSPRQQEYRVTVHVTLPDGTTRDLVGTNVRQWKLCMVPIAAARRDLAKTPRDREGAKRTAA
jgi:hypothetical protein